ncbi:uncharacterized protein [Elaeis guineensis]|uniref:Uncharacterized protein LOC105034058 n=1 Tax=Elaeis guineensis var. tenera TaxID=51953 RepID=A0A6I9QEM6_ELAGV|nr:uncharacterized protein LOC105034058 [Elaeis guineensis]
MFSISPTFALGPRRPGSLRSEFSVTAPLWSPATARPIGLGFRFGSAVSLLVKRRVPIVLSSGSSNPETTSKDKADRSSSGVAKSPPLLTILAALESCLKILKGPKGGKGSCFCKEVVV